MPGIHLTWSGALLCVFLPQLLFAAPGTLVKQGVDLLAAPNFSANLPAVLSTAFALWNI